MMNYYQPYNSFNPNELQNRINQLQQMLGQFQNNQNMQNNQNNININSLEKGIYVYVKDYQDVVNYPTSADGKATIFIGNGIMWSKKIMDGKNCIQAYSFAPINDTQSSQNNQPVNDSTSNNDEITAALLDNICERLNLIEEKISEKNITKETQGGKK